MARELAQRGHGVVLVARSEERLRALAGDLATTHGVRAEAVACDVTDPAARDRLEAEVARLGLRVDVLVPTRDSAPTSRSSRPRASACSRRCASTRRRSRTSPPAGCRGWWSVAPAPC